MFSHLSCWLGTAINLGLYCLNLKLLLIWILQFYSFAHWSWIKCSLAIFRARLIICCFGSRTEIYSVNLTLLFIFLPYYFLFCSDSWGWNLNFRNSGCLSFDPLSKNSDFRLFEILFWFNLSWCFWNIGDHIFLMRNKPLMLFKALLLSDSSTTLFLSVSPLNPWTKNLFVLS